MRVGIMAAISGAALAIGAGLVAIAQSPAETRDPNKGAYAPAFAGQTRAPALPAAPLPALLRAWRFLDQPEPESAPRTVADFWSHAARAWSRARLPPVSMLPAPGGA